MATKTNTYSQDDMEVSFPSLSAKSFKPKTGLVKITDSDAGSIVVNATFEDPRIPRLINGDYTLKAAEKTADHVWYKTE